MLQSYVVRVLPGSGSSGPDGDGVGVGDGEEGGVGGCGKYTAGEDAEDGAGGSAVDPEKGVWLAIGMDATLGCACPFRSNSFSSIWALFRSVLISLWKNDTTPVGALVGVAVARCASRA
jgi:hypothetical protein